MNFRIFFNVKTESGEMIMRKLILTRDEALRSPFKILIEKILATPACTEMSDELPVFGLTQVEAIRQREESIHVPIFADGF